MAALAQRVLFPSLVTALTAWAIAAPRVDLARALGAPPEANASLLMASTLLVFYPLVALLERLLPHRTEWSRAHGDLRTDVLHLVLTGPLANTLFQATLGALAVAAAPLLASRWGMDLWPAQWPGLAQLFLAILVAELGHYGFHRWSHESPRVWRLHATHHSAQRLYWLNATRFHPLDLFALIACQSAPLLLLGIPEAAFLQYTIFAIAYGQLQHCNVELECPRWLDWIFSSPRLHRWHHSTVAREGNSNYGAILSTWDLVFGSYFRPAERGFTGTVGLADLPGFPSRYLAQLASPFRWSRIAARRG